MDMVDQLDEITYRLVASAPSGAEARRRLAIVSHWAHEQSQRLARGRPVRVDHDQVVAEALAGLAVGVSAA